MGLCPQSGAPTLAFADEDAVGREPVQVIAGLSRAGM